MIELILGGLWKYILGGIGLVTAIFFVRKSGADALKSKHNEEVINDIKEVNDARRDRDELDSVQHKYTRD